MPVTLFDNCGTCWFNDERSSDAAAGQVTFVTCHCVLRGHEIRHPLTTYCANHPRHSPTRLAHPVGPVYKLNDWTETREVWLPSPDTEDIRLALLALLDDVAPQPREEYPSPTRFDDEVIRQLSDFREGRAVPGLLRVLGWGTHGSKDDATAGRDLAPVRRSTIGRAMSALVAILGAAATPHVVPILHSEDAELRLYAVRALASCGAAGRPALQQAAADPDVDVRQEAQRILGPDASAALGEALGIVQESEHAAQAAARAVAAGVRAIDLERSHVDPNAAGLIPSGFSRRNRLIILQRRKRTVLVAMADPLDEDAIHDVALLTRCEVQAYLAPPEEIARALQRIFG